MDRDPVLGVVAHHFVSHRFDRHIEFVIRVRHPELVLQKICADAIHFSMSPNDTSDELRFCNAIPQ